MKGLGRFRQWLRLAVRMALIGTLLLSLSGCWDQLPVETRAVVDTVGVDPTAQPNLLQWTFTFPNVSVTPTTLGTSSKSDEYYQLVVDAPDFATALRRVQSRTTRDLYFGQIRVVALSTKLPAPTWIHLIDTFNRSGRMLKTFWIVGTSNAQRAVTIKPPTATVPEQALSRAFACHCQPMQLGERAWQVWRDLATPGQTAVVPYVVPLADDHWEIQQLVTVTRHQLTVWSIPATEGWAYLTHRVRKLSVSGPSSAAGTFAITRIQEQAPQTHLTVAGSGVQFHVTLRVHGYLEELPADVEITPPLEQRIEQQASRQIGQMVMGALAQARRTGTDPFGWHRILRWSHGAEVAADPAVATGWSPWQVTVQVHFAINNEGVTE